MNEKFLAGGRPDKTVSYTMLGNDNAGCFGIVLDFLSEVLDMYPQQVPGIDVSVSPDFGQKVLMG